MRTLGALVVLATAALLAPGTSASAAATPLTVSVTCDARTGAIATSVGGRLLLPGSPVPVRAEFQRRVAYRVTAAGLTYMPTLAPFVVDTTTNNVGEVAANGYTATFDPAGAVFYREEVRVTFRNAVTGANYGWYEGNCSHDPRTTVTLTCNQETGVVRATVTGIDGLVGGADGSGWASRVGYHRVRTSQPNANEPGFRTELDNGAYDVVHRITRGADGTWSDAGYELTVPAGAYYYAEELTVGVLDPYGRLVGSGTASCAVRNVGGAPAA
ncbi:hypothetical protein [Catenuloplanes atrovinosus]|uniref:Uncharacterized protein n=1 Tax=Catenuloplanes atrovinosus TaxID=137266 RepID=A0AAE4C6L2_9ACTN|nr:hypothetical protein [Catenuloplanes atrovinosus]MDR7273626.1 hypothetical protein [Catenuloplanes atrovinosus]